MLTPLWWLWYGLAFLLSQSWALAVFIAVLSTVFLAVRQWRGQNSHRVRPRGGGGEGLAAPLSTPSTTNALWNEAVARWHAPHDYP